MQKQILASEQQKVGISEYLVMGPQIPAMIKYLLSDFIVNQIDKQQNLITLKQKPQENVKKSQIQSPSYELNQVLKQQIQVLLGPKLLAQIEKLYYQLECGQKVSIWQFVVEKQLAKDDRKLLHDFVRQKLHFIQSITHLGQIKLRFNKNIHKMNPNSRHKYTHFTLYKHGIDTFNAIFRLSKAIHVSEKLFSTAGLKDKRGHTTQKVSVYNTDNNSISKFYKEAYRNKEIWIDQIQQCKQQKVQVGGLSGNQFSLILRLINTEDGQAALDRVQSFRNLGMINYFGLQRFGQFSTKTYQLGAMCVRKQYKTLIESIILSDCNNFEVNRLKREIYQTRKYFRAQKALHNKFKIQKAVFKALQKYGENYQNVFDSMPRSIKTLYIHSLQSYLWNRLASRRLKQFGISLKIGDVVGLDVKNFNQDQSNQNKDQEPIQFGDEIDQVQVINTEIVTNENIHKFTIYDIVLPLFGPKTKLQQGSWLQSVLRQQFKALNLLQSDFSHLTKLQNSQAAWRRMFVKPEVIHSELIKHANPKQDLQTPFYTFGQKTNYSAGDLSAIRVILRLPKSSYATMAIRQMLHVTSQFQVQKQLNNLYESKYLAKQE